MELESIDTGVLTDENDLLKGEVFMNKIELLDLSSYNCWIVYLRPNGDYEEDYSLQQACIEANIFGMGWPLKTDRINEGSPCTQELQEMYLRLYPNTEPENALNLFAQMQKH